MINKMREGRKSSTYLAGLMLMFVWAFIQPMKAQAQWTSPDASTVSTTNNVGIGTNTPTSLQGGITGMSGRVLQLQNPSGIAQFNISSGGLGNGAYLSFEVGDAARGKRLFQQFYDGNADAMRFRTVNEANGTITQDNIFILKNNGNVGVGTNNPAGRFEIFNTGGMTPANYLQISGTTADNSNLPGISLKGGQTATEYPFLLSGNDGLSLTVAGGRSASYTNRMQLILSTNSGGYAGFQLFNGSVPVDLLTVKDNGRVGIGTITPAQTLTVSKASGTNYIQIDSGANGGYVGTDGTSFVLQPRNGGDIKFYNTDGTAVNLTIQNGGNVGIGGPAAANIKLNVTGALNATGTITGGTIEAKYQDVAEWVNSRQRLTGGTVVILDPEKTNQVIASTESYDTRVAGVVSDSPGVLLGEGGEGRVKVATTGRVKVRVDATRGAIKIGDLLVTSDEEGVAMKSEPILMQGRKIHAPGTIIGKALEPLASGKGEILVLLSLQ